MVCLKASVLMALVPLIAQMGLSGVDAIVIPVSVRDITTQDLIARDVSVPVAPASDATAKDVSVADVAVPDALASNVVSLPDAPASEAVPEGVSEADVSVLDAPASDVASEDVSPADADAPLKKGKGQCNANSECTAGMICVRHVCVPGCLSDRDCARGQACTRAVCSTPGGGHCKPYRQYCQSDIECCSGRCYFWFLKWHHVCK